MNVSIVTVLFSTMVFSCAVQIKESTSTPKELAAKASCVTVADSAIIKKVLHECTFDKADPYYWSLEAMPAPRESANDDLSAKLLKDMEQTSFTDPEFPETEDAEFANLSFVTKNTDDCQKQAKRIDEKYEVFGLNRKFRDEYRHLRAEGYLLYIKSRTDSSCWVRAGIGGEREYSH